jgi:hypothetical protein
VEDFDLESLTINPTDPTLLPARAGRAGSCDDKARRYFVKVPWTWVQKLDGAPGQTYRLALQILFLHFRERCASVTLSNRTIDRVGLPSQSKRRALRDLERRGLVSVEWRSKRSPVVHVLTG